MRRCPFAIISILPAKCKNAGNSNWKGQIKALEREASSRPSLCTPLHGEHVHEIVSQPFIESTQTCADSDHGLEANLSAVLVHVARLRQISSN